MNLRCLEYLIALEKTGNMTQAAKELYVSQSNLSQFLSHEEKRLGHKLFNRFSGKYIPTPAGKLYIDYAKKMIELTSQFNHKIANLSTPHIIRIGTTSVSSVKMLANILPKFKKTYPNAQPNIVNCPSLHNAVHALSQDHLDLSFVTTYSQDVYDGPSVLLSKEEIILGVPAAMVKNTPYAGMAAPRLSAPELAEFFGSSPFILQHKDSCIRHLVDAFFHEADFEPDIACNAADAFAITEMIASGLGLGFIPISNLVPSAEISYFSLTPGIYRLHMVYLRRDYRPTPVSQELIQLAAGYYTGEENYRRKAD